MNLDDRLSTLIDGSASPVARHEIGASPLHQAASRRRLLPLATISIGLAAIIALVVTMSVRDDQVAPLNSSGPTATQPFVAPTTTAPPPIVPAAPVVPQGVEYPIESIDPIDVGLGTPVTPLVLDQRSLRFWKTADATLFAVRTIDVSDDRASDGRCAGTVDMKVLTPGAAPVVNGWGYGCGPAWLEALVPLVGGGWDQPDGGIGHGTWLWRNVPPDTDFVEYRSGDLVLWQRPLGGMASFPATSENLTRDTHAIAYRADGAVLATLDDASVRTAFEAAREAVPGWMTGSQLPADLVDDGTKVATAAFTECLQTAGAVISSVDTGGVVDLPDGAAGNAVWLGCLGPAQDALDAYAAEHAHDVHPAGSEVQVAETEAPATTPTATTEPVPATEPSVVATVSRNKDHPTSLAGTVLAG
ncbi:MAG: hypothetical protein JWN62_3108 [Acidimicrobiales bacterium]|nr:hypothetical protein [Acidimicrobiales bacterium]